jgi:hypothetical protein
VGLLYLAFLDEGATMIELTHGTDNTNLTWTTPISVFQDAAYDDIRDPSVHLVSGVIYLSFLRHEISTGNYELCYTKANVSDLAFSAPVVVDTSTSAFEDAHIQAGTFFTFPVTAIIYEKASTLYLCFSADNGSTWGAPVLAQTAFSPTEDCDMVFLKHTGSLTQDFIVIWAQGTAGSRHIITRMGHFEE